MNEVQRCAECDCDNGGDECNWIATPKPTVVGYMCKTDYDWELASELAGTLWQWLELAERTMEDHALRLDANRAADFCQGIRETKTVLAKLDKGE